jgi:protein-L-isoaspartate(D-aspartate) O-methyltransferase
MADVDEMIREIEWEVAATRHYIGKDALGPRVMKAMRSVPRDTFMPAGVRQMAYDNMPVAIGYGQTISQPYIVALMTDLLDPQPDDIMLEVGTGSGYQAAVLSQLVNRVYSTETIDALADQAAARLQQLGYMNVEVMTGDGYYGWTAHAPYDGIIVTAAAPHIPQPLVEQLKPGARLVIPVGAPYAGQQLMLIEKAQDGAFSLRDVLAVVFVPLTGAHHDQPALLETWQTGVSAENP